jgi:DNA-binding CsgD family transcriptional regulator
MVTNHLTQREQEVLELIRRGLTNEEIAQRLGISLDGAKYHVSQILSKLGVVTREEAAQQPAPLEPARRRTWLVGLAGVGVSIAAAATIAVLAWGTARSGSGDEAADGAPETPVAELEQARELWASKGIDDYRFLGNTICHCASPGPMPVTVTVNHGAVMSLVYADGAMMIPKDPDSDSEGILSAWTIESLFAEIETRLGDAFHVSANYDPMYGFPTLIEVDSIEMAVDDEYTREISGFEVIED